MSHLSYIVPSYALAVLIPAAFAAAAVSRIGRARRRLAALGATR